MPYGFRVLRADGSVVVDDSSFAYTTTGSDNSNNYSQPFAGNVRGPIPYQPDELFFCEPAINQPFFSGIALFGGYCITTGMNFIRARPFSAVAPPSYGLAVYNEDGDSTFHTGSQFVSVLSSHSQFISAGGNPSPTNVSIPAETTHIAVASSTAALVPVLPAPNVGIVGVRLNRTSATNVQVLFGDFLGGVQLPLNNTETFPVTLSFITARIL